MHRKTQEKLDRLAKDRPDLDEKVKIQSVACHIEKPALAEHGTNQHSDRTLQSNLHERGNNANYLAARIKRDAPEIAERMKRGEFKSVRAAAIEAESPKITSTGKFPMLFLPRARNHLRRKRNPQILRVPLNLFALNHQSSSFRRFTFDATTFRRGNSLSSGNGWTPRCSNSSRFGPEVSTESAGSSCRLINHDSAIFFF